MTTSLRPALRRATIDRVRRLPLRAPAQVERDRPFSSSLRAAVVPWLAARAVVGGSLAALGVALRELAFLPEQVERHARQGLLGWDAERYLEIAVYGYERLPLREVRFFPLLPLLVRWADGVLPGGPDVALLAVTNIAALLFTALVHRLALQESGDERLATRAAWFSALAPAGFVLVWGYTEALAGALVAACLLAARTRRWGAVALTGALAGLVRPVGVLLCLPLAVEAFRRGERRARAVASALAPALGTGAYLAWVWRTFGSPLLPYTIQSSPEFRGAPTGAIGTLSEAAAALARGDVTVASLRVVWVVVAVLVVVVLARRWPAPYAVLAATTLLAALSASRLGSFERYALASMPAALAAASVTRAPAVERGILVLVAGAMATYGTLALAGLYIP